MGKPSLCAPKFFSLLLPLHWILGLLGVRIFSLKILHCTNIFLSVLPPHLPCNNVSWSVTINHRCLCFTFMSWQSWQCERDDSGGQSTKKKQISSLLRYSQDNHRAGLWTVRRSRIFFPFDREYFMTKQGLTEETKVNSIISSMFSKTSRLRLAPEMIPTPKWSPTLNWGSFPDNTLR